jgi:hypothetical protein
MVKRYTYWEYELIDRLYDEQFRYVDIAEQCNNSFHDGDKVRTVNSISYAIKKIYNDPRCLDFDWHDERGLIVHEPEDEKYY